MEFKDLDGIYESYMQIYEDVEDLEEVRGFGEVDPRTGRYTDYSKSNMLGSHSGMRNPPLKKAEAAGSRAAESGDYKRANRIKRAIGRIERTDLAGDMGWSAGYARGSKDRARMEKTRLNSSYDYDHYDIVLEYLLGEGLCESVENAEIMMAHMSEGWIDSILDEALVDKGRSDAEKEKMRDERNGGNRTTRKNMQRNVKKTPGAKKPVPHRFVEPKPRTADY